MKKLIMSVVVLLILMTSCSEDNMGQNKYQDLELDSTNKGDVLTLYELGYFQYTEFTITKDGKYTVVVIYDNIINFYMTHILVFSPKRELVDYVTSEKNIPIEPVTIDEDLNNFLSWDYKDIKEKYGEFHYSEGVGNEYYDVIFSPCYFSKDGYCVVFSISIEDGKVQGVYRYDLINEEIVEEYGENEKWLGKPIPTQEELDKWSGKPSSN